MQKTIERCNEKIQKMQNEKDEMENELVVFRIQLKELTNQEESLYDKQQETENKLKEAFKERDGITEKFQDLKREDIESSEIVASLNKELNALRVENHSLKEENKVLKEKISSGISPDSLFMMTQETMQNNEVLYNWS